MFSSDGKTLPLVGKYFLSGFLGGNDTERIFQQASGMVLLCLYFKKSMLPVKEQSVTMLFGREKCNAGSP